MQYFDVSTGGHFAQVTFGGTIESVVDEVLGVMQPGVVAVELVSGPDGGATISGTEVRFSKPGRYRLAVRTLVQGTAGLHVTACEPACLDRLPDGFDSRSSGHSDQRLTLRSLAANAPFFNGLASELVNQPLAQYGA